VNDRERLGKRQEKLRARLAVQKAKARAAVAARKAARGKKEQKPRRWPWLLAVLAALFLLRDCRCAEPPPEPTVEAAAGAGEATIADPAPTIPPLPGGRIDRVDRPAWEVTPTDELPWLPAFRLQVSARGPRLAACFEGAGQPGALRWTASLEPTTGHVSDQVVEPTSGSVELDRSQRACVHEVLASPPYELELEEPPATPVGVGLVVEF